MNRYTVFKIGLFCFALSSMTAFPVRSDESEPKELQLQIDVQNLILLPSEPLFINWELKNTSMKPIALNGRWKEMVHFQVKRNGKWEGYNIWWKPQGLREPLPPVTIKPGEVLSGKQVLLTTTFKDDPIYLADTQFFLRATLNSSKPSVNSFSNEITLKIMIPNSEKDAFAALLRNKSTARFLAFTLPFEKERRKVAETFIRNFPESVYSAYIRFTLLQRGDIGLSESLKDEYSKFLEVHHPKLWKYQAQED